MMYVWDHRTDAPVRSIPWLLYSIHNRNIITLKHEIFLWEAVPSCTANTAALASPNNGGFGGKLFAHTKRISAAEFLHTTKKYSKRRTNCHVKICLPTIPNWRGPAYLQRSRKSLPRLLMFLIQFLNSCHKLGNIQPQILMGDFVASKPKGIH